MQLPLQTRTRMAGRLDRLGLYLLVPTATTLWFYFLFQNIYPALPAGIALAVLILYTIHLFERRTLKRREDALRRRIGGEMAVDSLLLQSERSATNNVIAWLSEALSLDQFTAKAHGTLARHQSGLVFIHCLQKHPSSQASVDDVLAAVRLARRASADRCVLCATCDFSQTAIQCAADMTPVTRLLGRSQLIGMAGVVAPASDEQLRALGKRRRQKFRKEIWRARVFDPAKKRRYMLYGIGLSLMYLLTRQTIYVIPALVCLALFGLCRKAPRKKFTL